MVFVLGDIDADNQILVASTDLGLELTEMLIPDSVVRIHNNLLLAVGFCFVHLYAIRRLFFYKAIITSFFTTLRGIFYNYFNI